MIGKRFREYFTFTKKERNGIIVLLFILFITFILRIYQLNKSYGDIVLMDEEFKSEIEEFENSLKLKKEEPKTRFETTTDAEKEKHNWIKPVELFKFDPNQVTSKELAQLGFTEKQIEILNNYRQNGGLFFKKNDRLKIHGAGQVQYNFLAPYIVIESKAKHKREKLNH